MTFWRLGVVGSPISHSLSPQLHRAGLEYLGWQGSSERLDVDEQHAQRIREVMGEPFHALSVTMPLKAIAATMCDDLEETAAHLGVVNSLLWREGRLQGSSTDGAGFVDSLQGEGRTPILDQHVVILGAGGAARAIVHSLVRAGVGVVSVLGRNHHSTEALAASNGEVVRSTLAPRPIDLIVNTTPAPSRDEQPLLEGVTRGTMAVDITYEPRESPWLARHREGGCATMNGLPMLAHTVARQMNWWWNSDIPGSYLLSRLSEVLS